MSFVNLKGNFLDLIPTRDCPWEKAGDGRTFLLVPRFKNPWMKKIALKLGKSESVRVYLDVKGAEVWNLIDGSSSVEQIGKNLNREGEESVDQLYKRLSEFLSILAHNRFISFTNLDRS